MPYQHLSLDDDCLVLLLYVNLHVSTCIAESVQNARHVVDKKANYTPHNESDNDGVVISRANMTGMTQGTLYMYTQTRCIGGGLVAVAAAVVVVVLVIWCANYSRTFTGYPNVNSLDIGPSVVANSIVIVIIIIIFVFVVILGRF